MMSELRVGEMGEVEMVVAERHTAEALGSGDVPVLGTPAMIALMEQAAVQALARSVGQGETSVGVHVDVRHLAAIPVGATVTAQARVMLVEGRRVTLRVTASSRGEIAGEGIHERMVVDRERFLQRTRPASPRQP